MTDGGRERSSLGITRRQVLASTGTGALVGLAGCGGGGGGGDCSVDTSFSKEVETEFQCGEEAIYSFEVCNEGDEECTGDILITDNLPDGISYVDASGGWSNQGSGTTVELVDEDVEIAPDSCLTVEMTVEVASPSQFDGGPPGQVENCAELQINDESTSEDCVTHDLICEDPCPAVEHVLNTGYDQDSESELGTNAADEDWVIVADDTNSGPVPRPATTGGSGSGYFSLDGRLISHSDFGEASAGDSVTYEYCFCLRDGFYGPELNLQAQADDEISDIRLNGTSLSFSGNGSHTGVPIEEIYTDATLFQAGENCLTIVVNDTAGSVSGLTVAGTVRAENADCDCDPGGDADCDLSFEKEPAAEFYYGDQGTYVFEICNQGEEECSGPLTVRDTLPTGVSFDSVTGNWNASISGGTVAVTNDSYGGLAPGDCLTVEMTVDVAPPGEGPDEVENCADLFHDGEFVTENCVQHPLTHDDCELSLDKRVDEEFHFGQENTYVFEVCNEEDEPCSGPLTITDELPDGVSFVDIGGFWNATVSGGVVEATLDTNPLGPGDCLTVEMTVDVTDADDFPSGEEIENCAELFHAGDPIDEDCVAHPVTVDDCRLSFEKDIGAFGGFHFGGLGTYVYEICNLGDTECNGPLTIEDDLPDGISLESTSADWSTSLSGGVVTATNDDHGGLAPGDCVTMEMTVAVADADEFPGEGEVENCADLSYSGTQQTRDCVTHRVTPEANPCPPTEHVLNSGYDQDGADTLPDGANDEDWEIPQDSTGSGPTPRPATVVNSDTVSGTWPSPFADSRWIAHRADAAIDSNSNGETIEYRYCFCLNENFIDPELSLRIFADDEVTDIQLNGTSLSYSGTGSVSVGSTPIEESYTTPSLFTDGDNCLIITVADTNQAVSGLNVTGRVRAENAHCDCDPGGEPECDLAFEKSTTGEFHYGEQFQAGYTYEVCNEGDGECSGELEISDPLPDGITGPVSPGSGLTGSLSGGVFEGTIEYSGLSPGECLTRELLVTVEDADAFDGEPPHVIENCAELLEYSQVVSEECVRHEVTAGEPSGTCNLTLSKQTGEQFNFGDQEPYIFTVCNDGDGECTAPLEIVDELPDGLSFVEVSGGWSASVSSGTVTVTNDSYGGLAPGGCLEFEMTVEVASAEEYPGDPDRTTNCGTLRHGDEIEDDNCVTHDIQR